MAKHSKFGRRIWISQTLLSFAWFALLLYKFWPMSDDVAWIWSLDYQSEQLHPQ